MKRREFITLIGGGAAAWPLVARAQQQTLPVIGVVNSGTSVANTKNVTAFRQALKEAGFVDRENVVTELRWADNQFDRLPALISDLIGQPVAVIVGNTLAALRAKAATTKIPIVFTTGSDPVRDGLVTSLNRPDANITGVVFITSALASKRLDLLRQFVPKASTIGVFVNPNTPETEAERRDVIAAANALGQRLVILDVISDSEFETAFATLVADGVGALYVGTGTFFFNSLDRIVALAARNAIPAIYAQREAVVSGGLMSYASSISDAYRQAGVYVGRILKGEKPTNLPVVQNSKFGFVINLKTAERLGLEFHPQLLATADEVIE